MQSLHVSILAACRNERSYIGAFLDSLASQECPGISLEAVIADGMSDDGTGELLEKYVQRHSPSGLAIRVIENPGRTAACGLNLALQASQGRIVLRMDAHTEYAPDYVAQCLRVLSVTGAANVGGPALARGRGYWQEAIALAFRSPFFSGGARFHDPAYEGRVDTVPYGCWRRETLEAVGGFDETLLRNQDDELNFRITRSGGVVWQSPSIRSWYHPRCDLGSLTRQYYEYGYWKCAVIAKHGRPAHRRHLVPAAAAAILATLVMAASFVSGARIPLFTLVLAYAGASAIASVVLGRARETLRLMPALPLVFATVHASYAAGFLAGQWKQRYRKPILPTDVRKPLATEPQPQ
jgi:succinoglycan biosynthesis protein ExoA